MPKQKCSCNGCFNKTTIANTQVSKATSWFQTKWMIFPTIPSSHTTSHTTPLLCSLHWLPIAAYIRLKTLMLAYKDTNGPVPTYLKALHRTLSDPLSLLNWSNNLSRHKEDMHIDSKIQTSLSWHLVVWVSSNYEHI